MRQCVTVRLFPIGYLLVIVYGNSKAEKFPLTRFDFHFVEVNPKAHLILVVDECSREIRDRLEHQAQRCEGRLKLLTVGLAEEARTSASRIDTYLLERLDDQSIRALLTKDYSHVPMEAIDFIIRKSSGFVKLAVTLAQAILEHPEKASARELMRTQRMQEVIAAFLVPDQADRGALQAVALLSRVGWDGELAAEGQTVAEFIGLDWRDAQRRVGRFVEKGFVARQGRYRYVTPHLLAVTLAAQAWDDYGEETLSLIAKLPTPSSRRALLERLYDLGDDLQAKQVTEMLLGVEGVFPDLASINDDGRAEIFALLAEMNPQVGLRALQRLIEHLPRSELLTFYSGRRQVVRLLEKLAWSKQTFFGAARLLLQLADAENEYWANNAGGVWVDLFGTFLGGTAVPAIERHVLIQEALNSSSEAQQRLAIRAIARVFSLQETRTFGVQDQGGRLVEPEWHPQNYAEDRAVRESGLALWDQAATHENPKIQVEARNILLRQARELARSGLTDAVIERLEKLPLTNQEERYKLRSTIDVLLEFETATITPERKQRLNAFRERIIGSSFADRLRRWTGRSTIADWKNGREPGGRTMEQEAADLADEAMNAPDTLRPELCYLATEAPQPYAFGKRLGELDAAHLWWNEIEAFVRVGQGYALASAYLQGNVEAGRNAWRDASLNAWVVEATHEFAVGVFDAVWRSEPDDKDGERLIALLDRGVLEAGRMGNLIMGGMTRHFSSDIFMQLVERVLRDDSEAATASALALIHQRLDFHTEDEQTLTQHAWRALEHHDTFSGDTMTQHYAKELAERYQAHDPLRMVRAVLQHLETQNRPLLRSNKAIQVLEQATNLQSKEVWNEVAVWLTSDRPNRLHLYLVLQGWYAQIVGAEVILEWAEQHQPDGPELVAAPTEVRGNPLDALPRTLLIRYGQNEAVAGALSGNFMSGSFWGDTSQWLEGLRTAALPWTNDAHRAVRSWAQRLVDGLDKRIEDWKLVEEERVF